MLYGKYISREVSVSVLETIIGKRKPQFENYNEVLDLVQKFMIESKSMSPIRDYTPQQQIVIMMYNFGALAYLAETIGVPEEENILVLDAYLQRKGLSQKQSRQETKKIMQQANDPSMQWHVEIGYNSARYWHKENDPNAPKALARLLKTMR